MKPFGPSSGGSAPLLFHLLMLLAAPAASGAATPSLVRIDVDRPLAALGVPFVAHFQDDSGQEYVLSRASVSDLEAAGVAYTMVDPDASDAGYLVALERRPGGLAAARSGRVLLDDGLRLVVRADTRQGESLAAIGFALTRLPERPVRLRALVPTEYRAGFDPGVEAMVAEVEELTVWDYDGDLSGENPVTIGGSDHTLTTRHTASGGAIQKATRHVFEHMDALGLDVSNLEWSDEGYAGRNVIGEHTGLSAPDEIVLVTAHLDSGPDVGRAPGADDNASGCVAVMIAADILSQRSFERTIRFALFTGEEQGLLGSTDYARRAAAAEENIVAVLNLDMIGWDERGGPTLRLHTRPSGNPGYPGDKAIADAFTQAVDTYALETELMPLLAADGVTASDHSPFWNEGYPAILAIEDDASDFNPYYHSADDRRQYLNLTYFTNFVRAAVATVAHLAELTGSSEVAPPNRLAAEILTPSRALLTWHDRSDNETFFEIQIKPASEGWQPATTANADRERARIGRLDPAVAYSFRVRAASLRGSSAWSKKAELRTPEELPRPGSLRATARSPSRVVLRWRDRSDGEEVFELQMKTGRSAWALAATAPADAERFVVDDLAPQTTYRFRVRARGAEALSHWSAKRKATTPALPN